MTAPMKGSVPTATPVAASESGAVSASSSDDPAPAPTLAIPVPSGTGAVTAGGNASSAGSIDTCGSNGGQTCKAGMCCSSHGYTSHHHTSMRGSQLLTIEIDIVGQWMNTAETAASPNSALALHRSGSAI